MDRRQFIAGAASLMGLAACQPTSQEQAPWPPKPKEWVFEGTKVREFLWPKDRLIALEPHGGRCYDRITIPTFDYREVGGVEKNLRHAIRAQDYKGDKVAYLFRVEGYPYLVGMMVDDGVRYEPITDFFHQRGRYPRPKQP